MTETARAAAGAVDALYGFARTAIAFGDSHPSTQRGASMLRDAIAAAKPPLTLQFVDGCVFRDKVLVPAAVATFKRGAELGKWLRKAGAEELSFDAGVTDASLGRLATCFVRAARGERDPLADERLEGLRARRIPHAVRGEDVEDVAADVFAAAQLGIAIEGVRNLVQTSVWPWRAALGCLRRLDRAVALHPRAVMRVLELADLGSVTRRVTGCAVLVHMTLGAAGVSTVTRRVLSHVALCLGAQGMAARGALPFSEAVERSVAAVLGERVDPDRGTDPHRAQVVAALVALSDEQVVPGEALLRLAYEVESERSPKNVDFDHSTLDRFAELLRSKSVDPERDKWLRITIHAFGVVPPGARVRLADGRVGVVLDAGLPGDPMRPLVLVGTESVRPSEPVHLLPGVA